MKNEDTPASRSWVWAPVVVFGGLILIAVVLMGVTSYDRQNSSSYIRILEAMLAWPVLAFGMVLVLTLIFHAEFSSLLKNLYVKKLSTSGLELDIRPQPEVPAGERPILEETNVVPLIESAPSPTRDRQVLEATLKLNEQEIERWRIEAKHWWHRYLTVFLTPPTRELLRYVARNSPLSKQQFQEAVGIKRFRHALVYEAHDALFPIRGNFDERRVKTDIALSALDQYRLVDIKDEHPGDPYLSITDEGKAFLAFLDSPDGLALQEDLHTGVYQFQHEFPAEFLRS